MPRPRGPHGRNDSTVLAVRVPLHLKEAILQDCGGQQEFAQWARNHFRQACRIPLDREVGYDEGYSAGWADANKRFRDAVKKAS